MEQNRRQVLLVLTSGIATLGISSSFTRSAALAGEIVRFKPDATAIIAGKTVEIDIALLGPNGEMTSGFLASLDPFHGKAFEPGWGAVYDHYLKGGVRSTDPDDISAVIRHIGIHGIPEQDLVKTYLQAKEIWEAYPDLRRNSDQASAYEIGNGHDEQDYVPLLGKHDHD